MGRLTHLTMAEGQPAQLLVQSTCGRTIVMDIPRSEWTKENRISVNSIVKLVVDVEGIPQSAIRLTSGSKDMRPNQELTADEVRALPTVRILLGLAGGKGGFGAMLRNLGKNIDTKNMNYDACRDLSGRRMRHVSNEKKLKDWFHHQEDREKEEKQTKDDAAKVAAPEAESSEAATGTTKRGRSYDDEAPQPIDLQKVESEQALVDLGMAQLAAACRLRGLKAGGTAAERAQRLWAIKGPPELSGDDVPATLRAGKKKGKK